jgi:hypothetical protein
LGDIPLKVIHAGNENVTITMSDNEKNGDFTDVFWAAGSQNILL